MAVPEATMRQTEHGERPEGEGWFVLNLGDAVGMRHELAGIYCPFEAADAHFPDFGINVHVLAPGEPNAQYHAEGVQEGFLVLAGECTLIVEEQERTLRAWDYAHFPAGTRHVVVGAGDGPCAVLMIGRRDADAPVRYPVSEVAARHGASVTEPTDSPAEAYASWPSRFTPERFPWPPR